MARGGARGPALPTSGATLFGLLGLAVLAALILIRYRPPAPKPADAAATEFSATRAAGTLARLLGDGAPHPVGSAAHAGVRDRIIALLRDLGLDPQIQTGYACEHGTECAAVENLVARIDGGAHDGALLLAAHYDSVPAGPGASDDGAGVAALIELVRALRAGPAMAHDLILLASDGEEAGLLGARVFVAGHPWAAEVRAAVNLEARGSGGPSFMFETGSRNSELMRDYAARVARPITSSIYYTAYKLLPNDTDFTVFKTRDWQGYNFAWTGRVQDYHTPHDDLAHLDLGALQHQGDNALGVVRALASEAWPAGPPSDAVYVDLLAASIIQWSVDTAWLAALALAITSVVVIALLWQRGLLRLRETASGLAMLLSALLAAALLDYAAIVALRALAALPPSAAGYDWTAQPLPIEIATAALALFAVFAAARLSGARSGYWGAWSALLAVLVVAALASARLLPGLSFLPLLPAALAVAGALPALLRGDSARARACAALPVLWATALTLLPTLIFLYPLLGVGMLPICAALGAWMLAPLLPLAASCGRRPARALLSLTALTVAAALAAAAAQPAYSPRSPQRLNLEYAIDADAGRAEWLARPDSGALPPALAAAAPFAARSPPFPWSGGAYYAAAAPLLALSPPELQVLAAETDGPATRYRLRLRSPRGASALSLCFAQGAQITAVQLDETPVDDADASAHGRRCLHLDTLPADGIRLAFTQRGGAAELLLSDRSYGLPAEAAALLAARPRDTIASQNGDQTRVTSRLSLAAPPQARRDQDAALRYTR